MTKHGGRYWLISIELVKKTPGKLWSRLMRDEREARAGARARSMAMSGQSLDTRFDAALEARYGRETYVTRKLRNSCTPHLPARHTQGAAESACKTEGGGGGGRAASCPF